MNRPINHSEPSVSIEYFPPIGLSAERALMTGAHALRRFQPDFQTITFGAGGSGVDVADATLEWALQLQGLNEIPTASHIALNHFTRESLAEFAAGLWVNGIRRLVVLRGDAVPESGEELAGYASVADAVRAIKALYPFDVSVAAYPEIHPKASSVKSDFDVLLAKQDAGADRAVTQYFFSNDDFYRFRDQAVKHGLRIDLIPGVIPIVNFDKIKLFSEKCGASIPERFETLFEKTADDKARKTAVARALIEEQVRDLAHNSVEALHIYSLNRVDLTADAIRAFQGEFERDTEEFRPALVG